MLYPAKSLIGGHEVDTNLWLKSPQQQNNRVLKVRTGPSPYTFSPSVRGDRNLEMRLTSSNNLFPSGSTFESSRNASSPTKQISCPSYTKREKKFGRETPQKKTLGAACPLPGWYLQGRPKWSLARSPSLECPDSLGESESSGSPFSSSLLSLTTWGKQKGTVSKGCHTMVGPWSPAALEDSQVSQREPWHHLFDFYYLSCSRDNCWTSDQSHNEHEPGAGRARVPSSWKSRVTEFQQKTWYQTLPLSEGKKRQCVQNLLHDQLSPGWPAAPAYTEKTWESGFIFQNGSRD